MEGHLHVIEKKRKKASSPSSKTTVRLPDELHIRIKKAAIDLRLSLQDFVAAAAEEKLRKIEETAAQAKSKRA